MLLKQLNERLTPHSYVFIILDPHTGEFEEYARGSMLDIVRQIEQDPDNSMIADVIKKQKLSNGVDQGGNIAFPYDDHLYMFVPI